MSTEPSVTEQAHPKVKMIRQGGGGDTVYSIGVIGACAYFLKGATTFQEKALAILKGFVWPGYLVYELFMFLHKPAE